MSRRNQRDVILDVLQRARGQEVPLPAILSLRISQFGARIKELRAEGHIIRNRVEHRDGQVFSWYRLESSSGEITRATPRENTRLNTHGDAREQIAPATFPQFGDLTKEMEYPG
ncbi:MAG: hypothetical protein WBV55_05825 [Candidatus Sulfotelmatobacter sp.]